MNNGENKRHPNAFKAKAIRLQKENHQLKQVNEALRRRSEVFKKSLVLLSAHPWQKGLS